MLTSGSEALSSTPGFACYDELYRQWSWQPVMAQVWTMLSEGSSQPRLWPLETDNDFTDFGHGQSSHSAPVLLVWGKSQIHTLTRAVQFCLSGANKQSLLLYTALPFNKS